jgi:hypothetical protein
MKKTDIYEIVIKILGLVLLYQTMSQLGYIVYSVIEMFVPRSMDSLDGIGMSIEKAMQMIFLGAFILLLLTSFLLIFKSHKIARFINKGGEDDTVWNLSINRATLYEMTLLVIGAITLIQSAPTLLFRFNNWLRSSRLQVEFNDHPTYFIWIELVKAIFGIVIIYFSKSISNFISIKSINKKNN